MAREKANKTVCELLADEDWTKLQVDHKDGLNIYSRSCIYGSRVYKTTSFSCCAEHKQVLKDFCNNEIEADQRDGVKRREALESHLKGHTIRLAKQLDKILGNL